MQIKFIMKNARSAPYFRKRNFPPSVISKWLEGKRQCLEISKSFSCSEKTSAILLNINWIANNCGYRRGGPCCRNSIRIARIIETRFNPRCKQFAAGPSALRVRQTDDRIIAQMTTIPDRRDGTRPLGGGKGGWKRDARPTVSGTGLFFSKRSRTTAVLLADSPGPSSLMLHASALAVRPGLYIYIYVRSYIILGTF